jgi:hypothetical protein
MYIREGDSDAVRGGLGGSRVAKLAKRNPCHPYIFIITRALLGCTWLAHCLVKLFSFYLLTMYSRLGIGGFARRDCLVSFRSK